MEKCQNRGIKVLENAQSGNELVIRKGHSWFWVCEGYKRGYKYTEKLKEISS